MERLILEAEKEANLFFHLIPYVGLIHYTTFNQTNPQLDFDSYTFHIHIYSPLDYIFLFPLFNIPYKIKNTHEVIM